MRQLLRVSLVVVFAPLVSARIAAEVVPVLPPLLEWHGKSEALVLPPEHPWATPFERHGLNWTPRYDETVAWVQKLVAASAELKLVTLGKSPEGRDLWMIVASREHAFTPQALKATGKPTLLAQAGIHAGEIDGKDAGLMLLRDIAVLKTKAKLLDGANLLFVPIYNVDGHEHFSPRRRINQRGPEQSGWRTTARNLNLNRDYAKLDAPESRAMVHALDEWEPALYLDLHVTDGADYQYDVTFGHDDGGFSPAITAWLKDALEPALGRDLEAMGHIPGPLIQMLDDKDPSKGIQDWTATPRFSTAYGDVRHIPTLLVENHSLKPYRQRVLGTYVLLESALRALAHEAGAVRTATDADRRRRPETIPLDWKVASSPTGVIEDFKGIEWRLSSSAQGGTYVEWLGKPTRTRMPRTGMPVSTTATRPAAYWIPPAWADVIERVAMHGIRLERITSGREVEVEVYRVSEPKLSPAPFEGHIPVTTTIAVERRKEYYPAGSARVPTDQPLGDLAAVLLEPASPDSFFQWGFFLEVLQPTEYVEAYIMAPMAERMLAEDPGLKAEFEQALATHPDLAKDEKARLQWFYRRTPYMDARYGLYPVGRER